MPYRELGPRRGRTLRMLVRDLCACLRVTVSVTQDQETSQVALGMMKRSVRKRAGFDLDAVAPLDVVPTSHIAALFGASSAPVSVCVSLLPTACRCSCANPRQ